MKKWLAILCLLVWPIAAQCDTRGVAVDLTTGLLTISNAAFFADNIGWLTNALTGVFSSGSYAISSGYATNAGAASTAGTATFAVSSGYATNAGYAASSAYATNAGDAATLGGVAAEGYSTTNQSTALSNSLTLFALAAAQSANATNVVPGVVTNGQTGVTLNGGTAATTGITNAFATTNLLTSTSNTLYTTFNNASNTLAAATLAITNGVPTTGLVESARTNAIATNVVAGVVTNGQSSVSLNGGYVATTNLVNTTSNTLAAATLAVTNGFIYATPPAPVQWDGSIAVQTVQMSKNLIYWYTNPVSVNQTINLSNATAGCWTSIAGTATNTLAPTATLSFQTATTNWLTGIWSGWSTGKYDRVGIDCLSVSPTNLSLGYKESP